MHQNEQLEKTHVGREREMVEEAAAAILFQASEHTPLIRKEGNLKAR